MFKTTYRIVRVYPFYAAQKRGLSSLYLWFYVGEDGNLLHCSYQGAELAIERDKRPAVIEEN